MADLGMPTLTITIKKAVETVAARLKNGVAAVIVRDAGAAAGLYGGQFAPSSGDRPSGGRGKLLYYFLQNILWLAENDLQGRILILAGGGLLLCGLGLTVLAKRMG